MHTYLSLLWAWMKPVMSKLLPSPISFNVSQVDLCFALSCSQSYWCLNGRWDCSFHHGSMVQAVDGHTAILHHCLQLDWFHM